MIEILKIKNNIKPFRNNLNNQSKSVKIGDDVFVAYHDFAYSPLDKDIIAEGIAISVEVIGVFKDENDARAALVNKMRLHLLSQKFLIETNSDEMKEFFSNFSFEVNEKDCKNLDKLVDLYNDKCHDLFIEIINYYNDKTGKAMFGDYETFQIDDKFDYSPNVTAFLKNVDNMSKQLNKTKNNNNKISN